MRIIQINTHEVVRMVYCASSPQNTELIIIIAPFSELIIIINAPRSILLGLGSSKGKTEL